MAITARCGTFFLEHYCGTLLWNILNYCGTLMWNILNYIKENFGEMSFVEKSLQQMLVFVFLLF